MRPQRQTLRHEITVQMRAAPQTCNSVTGATLGESDTVYEHVHKGFYVMCNLLTVYIITTQRLHAVICSLRLFAHVHVHVPLYYADPWDNTPTSAHQHVYADRGNASVCVCLLNSTTMDVVAWQI